MPLHQDTLVIDAHTDVPTRLWESPADLSQRLTDRHVDLPRLRQGGVSALDFALYVPADLRPPRWWEHAKTLYEVSEQALLPGELVQADTAGDVHRSEPRGHEAVLLPQRDI